MKFKTRTVFLRPRLRLQNGREFLPIVISCACTTLAYSQTIEIDPAGPIPSTHTAVFQTNWDTNGNLEGWGSNQMTLQTDAPVGGIVTGTVDDNDPQLTRSGLNIPTSATTIIEFSLRKEVADTSRIDLFWGDDNGGISPNRMINISTAGFPSDDQFHVVRITYNGQLIGPLNQFRFDVASDAVGLGKVFSVDYFRVYSVVGATPDLKWDPSQAAGNGGGSGTWNTVSNNWWNGTSQTNWPAVSTFNQGAVFGGPAGTVTIQPAGITAATLQFDTADYVLAGGPLTLDGTATIRSGGGRFFLDAPLAGTADIVIATGNPVIRAAGTQTGSTTLKNQETLFSVDSPFGTGKVVLGTGNNVFITAIDQVRTLTNDVEFRGNRLIINNDNRGQGVGAFGVVISGGLLLAGDAPSDIFLRRSLTVNGVVSGAGPNGRSLYFLGDAGTMALRNEDNTFVGDIVFDVGARLEFAGDGGLGDSANKLVVNSNGGTFAPQSDWETSRPLAVNGDTAAIIDTDSQVTWKGPITSSLNTNSRLYKTGDGTFLLAGTATLGGGTQVREGTLEIVEGGLLNHKAVWDNNHGVAGGATMRVNGGEFVIDGSFYGVGNGETPDEEALFEVADGKFIHNGGQLLVGFRGNGRFVMKGGEATVNEISYGDGDAARAARIDLDGGTFSMNRAVRRDGDGAATIHFNGTTIQALSNQADFLDAGTAGVTNFLVGNGGAIFDTADNDVVINASLAHDPQAAAVDGGLTKQGGGSAFLNATQSYTGATTVTAGTLGGNGALNGNVTVAAGAGLAVQVNQTTGTDHSQWAISGTLQVPASLVIRILPGADAFAETTANGITVVTAAGGITGFDAANVTFDTSTFTGTGTWSASQVGNSIVLGYVAGAPGGYDTFAATITDPLLRGRLDDADHDGIANFLEYVLGGNPNASDRSILPQQTLTASQLTLAFNRSATSLADADVVVALSTDLLDWTTILPIAVTGSGAQQIQIPRESRTRLFARVIATAK